MAKENNFLELHVIAPTLRAISEDYRVVNVARQRAKHLLSLAEPSSSDAAQR
jgi:ribosomal protein L28